MDAKKFWTAVTVGIVIFAYASGAVLYVSCLYTGGLMHEISKIWLVSLLAIPVIAALVFGKLGAKLMEMEIPDWAKLTLGLTAALSIVVVMMLMIFLLP